MGRIELIEEPKAKKGYIEIIEPDKPIVKPKSLYGTSAIDVVNQSLSAQKAGSTIPSPEEEALIPKTGPAEALTYGVVGAPAGIAGATAATGFNVLQEVGTEEVRSQLPEGQAYDWLAMIIGMGGSLAAGTAPSLLLKGKPRISPLTSQKIRERFAENRALSKEAKETPLEYSGEIRKPVSELGQPNKVIESAPVESAPAEAPLSPRIEEVKVEATPTSAPKQPKTIIVQRIEEPGVKPGSPDKPHGLYVSPAEIESPHKDLGGKKTTYEITPKNPLDVTGELEEGVVSTGRPGLYQGHAIPASAGIKALKRMLPDKFDSLMKLNKKEAIEVLSKLYPDVDWKKYYDSYEMMEAVAGIEARKRGYDVIIDLRKDAPEFSEYVVLSKNIISELGQPNKVIESAPVESAPAELPPELAKPEVRLGSTGNIAKAAKDKAVELSSTEAAGQGKRLYHQVAEALDKGDIEVEFLPEILQKYNIDLTDFVSHYKDTISTSARKLQQLSALKKHLTRLAETGQHPELEGILDKLPNDFDTFWHRFNYGWGKWPGYVKVDNVRRASLVSQLATTIRNVVSQTGNYGLHILDKTLEKQFGGSNSIEASEYIATFFGQFKKAERDRVISIIEKFPLEEARLLNTPAGEVTLGHQYTRTLNTLNNMQESFFRRATFDASLREQLRQAKFDIPEMMNNPGEIPEAIIHRAVNDALDVTFAQMPKEGTFGNAVLKAYKAIPPLTLINPFPRFLANSYKFLMEHSPAGYLKLIEKTQEGKFLAGIPAARAKILAKATTGTLLLGAALAIRESDLAGEKWYQIKVGDKNMDMRPFAPFSTFLFMSEALKQISDTGVDVIKNGKDLQEALMANSKMTTQDIIQGLISINRIAGTGLVLVDLVRSGSVGKKMDMLRDVLAQYIGGFTVPFRTIKDAISGVSEEEAKFRDTRKTLLGPALTNIPGVSQKYPESVSPIETETPKSEYPVLRQLTGLSLSQAKPVKEEINKLGLEPVDYLPQTGYPEADREISKIMRTRIDTILLPLIRSTRYRNGNDIIKKLILTESLSSIKKDAFKQFKTINPELPLEIYKKGMDKDIRAVINLKGGD